jgi:hypothetical protein
MGKRIALVLVGMMLSSGPSWAQLQNLLPPSLGGLPADAPPRPDQPYQYPAVHDMPPPRAVKPLTDSELIKLQQELQAAREKQEKAAAEAQAPVAPGVAGPAAANSNPAPAAPAKPH